MTSTPAAAEHPAAITIGAAGMSHPELRAAAAAVADRVAGCPMAAVPATTSLHTVVAVLGCLTAGVPVVPVPPDSGPAEARHLLRDSKARIWLSPVGTGPAPGEAADLEAIPVDLDERSARSYPPPDPDSAALVMYTSGTTGLPKGAVLSHRAIEAGLAGLADAWAWGPDDVVVHGLPLFHVHGLILGVLGPLRTGGRLIHSGGPRPEGYAAAAAAGGTLFFAVPTIWSRIAADAALARALSGARLLVSGSAGLPSGVARALAEHTGQIPVERYGMTETLITIAARADQRRRVGWVGRPIAGVSARLVDDHGDPVPPDGQTLGDLHIRGATMFDGYLGRAADTAAAWPADGWFRTGDVAVADADGCYRIVGRRSADLIKSGGYRIGAGEVEAVLLDHPEVAEVAVVGLPDADLGQRIVAFVVPAAGRDRSAAASTTAPEPHGNPSAGLEHRLIEHVATELSVHKRPREVRFVDALPRNEMGKVQKGRLVPG